MRVTAKCQVTRANVVYFGDGNIRMGGRALVRLHSRVASLLFASMDYCAYTHEVKSDGWERVLQRS